MLNKCASVSAAGQGSNDEFKHLIQVNARKFNLFSAWNIFKQTTTETLSRQFARFVCFWVSWRNGEWRPLTHLSTQLNDIFSHDWPRLQINFQFLFLPFQIYTEWANYYLERHKSKRKVVDLSVDARDGLLLAEIIEAVTSFKVPDLIKKPKTQQQTVSHLIPCNQSKKIFCRYDCQINVVVRERQ